MSKTDIKIVEEKSSKKRLTMPKFSIGDVVCMKDDFHFNPCYKTMSIGKVEAIHMQVGKGSGARFKKALNKYVRKDHFGRILYTVSGLSFRPDEDKLELFTKKQLKIIESWRLLTDKEFARKGEN